MFNFNHLYYFYVTAKSGGVGTAAAHLRISQPSLSSQIKVLEGALELRLFRRVGRANQLTEEGSMIYGICRQMFEHSEQLEDLLQSRETSAARRIYIGVSDEVDRPFVVEIVSVFLKKHGVTHRPRVCMVSGSHDQLVERLRFRELDAIVTQHAMIDPELHNLEMAEIPVGLICPGNKRVRLHPRRTGLQRVVRQIVGADSAQWLMPSPRFRFRTEIDRFLESNRLKGRVAFESDVIASLVRSVVDEVGWTFLPLIYVAHEMQEKSVRVLGPRGGFWKYGVWLACHEQNKTDDLVHALSGSFHDVCQKVSEVPNNVLTAVGSA